MISTPRCPQVSIPARLAEFPDQSFRDSHNLIMCGACVCTVPNIKGSLVKHVATHKHIARLKDYNAKTTEDLDLMSSLGEHFARNPDLAGATVGVHEQLYRFRVCQVFFFLPSPLALSTFPLHLHSPLALIPLHSTSCLQAFMYAGVALFKAGMLRTLLERSGHSCTAGNHLAQFIPKACSHPLGLFPPPRPAPNP